MKEMKTPYYVIQQDPMDENFEHLCESLDRYWPKHIIGYSYKTNSCPWLVNHFQEKGCYAEVVSEDEYELSKLLGVNKDRLIYNGPIKSKESFAEAISRGCIVNIDSHRELDWIVELVRNGIVNYKIGIRVNFDIEKYCPNHSACGEEGGRFGFCYENGELKKAIDFLSENGVKLSGLHLHTSSKTREVCIYEAISKVAVEIADIYKLELDYIDIGGGFFGGLVTKPSFDIYFEAIKNILKQHFDSNKTILIVEPGMAVVGAFVKYITTVIDVKDTSYNRFVVTDGSRTSIDPLMTKTSYAYEIVQNVKGRPMKKQVISGFTCMEHDRLFNMENEPELYVGDHVVYNKVGAYTMCLSPLFISYFPDIYIEHNGEFDLVREKWNANQYVMNCNKRR